MHRHVALLALLLAPVGPHIPSRTPSHTAEINRVDVAVAEGAVADITAAYRGGTAARLIGGDTPVPGDVFELLGLPGLDLPARVWDETPYPYSRPEEHPDSRRSNADARALVAELVGERIAAVELTTPSGGGSSVGLAYTLGYLNLWADGGFTGAVSVAATGRLEAFGWIGPVTALDEKLAAAAAAGVDVVFTPTWPDESSIEEHEVRQLGTLTSSRFPGAVIGEARKWDEYRRWGSELAPDRIDLVGVRHIGDVAAYLCGAGSPLACDLLDVISAHVRHDPALLSLAGARPDGTVPPASGPTGAA